MLLTLSVSHHSNGTILTPPTSHVTYANFILNTSWLIKGSPDQRSKLFVYLLTPPLNVKKIEDLLRQFLTLLYSSNKVNSAHFPQIHDWPANEESLRGVVSHMTESLRTEPESMSRPLDKIELQIWLMATPLANTIIQLFFKLSFIFPQSSLHEEAASEEESLLPQKVIHPILKDKFNSTLLDHASLTFIHNSLPYETRGVAYPLFSTQVHGDSFSTLCRQILEKGPTLIVIRDTKGFVFGGVANDDWKFNPQFTGKPHLLNNYYLY